MKRCIQDDKLESEIAAWNKRAQMTPEQDIEKEEPAPVECKQRRRSLLLIGVRLLLGHNGWSTTITVSEVTVMLESYGLATVFDSIKNGSQFPHFILAGEVMCPSWGYRVSGNMFGKTFRQTRRFFDAKMDSNHHPTLLESAALPIRAADPCG